MDGADYSEQAPWFWVNEKKRIDHEGGGGRIVMLAARQVMEVGGREI